ncbi:hypothetical protein [Delftia phage PhiW-14]|uniref:Uncharacterized protein n=1 Tax=Delftia phage PhiW-14 TaxID=665032 RepID=C9DG15_BPW14|nr:hypothetical protein DP-phiW-14_gp043 [Delftia phage PhiW-14]ACV50066.1 hypothetical protein [Delftia phage PhiW-14]
MNMFKTEGFGALFAKKLTESANKDLVGKGNPNGTPNGVADTAGIGDKTKKSEANPLGAGSPNPNKGEGLPDKRAPDPKDANGKGSPNGTPNGTKGGPKIDGAPASNGQPDAKKENDNCEFADKKGKVNEALKETLAESILNAFRVGLHEAADTPEVKKLKAEIKKINQQMDVINDKMQANSRKHGDTELSGDRAAVSASNAEMQKLKTDHKALVAKLKPLETKVRSMTGKFKID